MVRLKPLPTVNVTAEFTIGFATSISSEVVSAPRSLVQIVGMIREDQHVKRTTESHRQSGEKNSRYKLNLPLALPGYSPAAGRTRKYSDKLSAFLTPLYVYDVDRDIHEGKFRTWAKHEPSVVLYARSAGGKDFWMLVQGPLADSGSAYTEVHKTLQAEFPSNIRDMVDPSGGSDPGRARFIAHDPDVYFNPTAKPLKLSDKATERVTAVSKQQTEPKRKQVKLPKNFTIDRYEWVLRQLSPSMSYEHWSNVLFASINGAYGCWGRSDWLIDRTKQLFCEWSQQDADAWRKDGKQHVNKNWKPDTARTSGYDFHSLIQWAGAGVVGDKDTLVSHTAYLNTPSGRQQAVRDLGFQIRKNLRGGSYEIMLPDDAKRPRGYKRSQGEWDSNWPDMCEHLRVNVLPENCAMYIGDEVAPFENSHSAQFKSDIVAGAAEVDPLREWLQTLPEWDKQSRLEQMFVHLYDAEDTELVRFIGRAFMTALALRTMHDHTIQWDMTPVLVGGEGTGKTTLCRILPPDEEYYTAVDDLSENRRDLLERCQQSLIVELAELDTRKANQNRLKNWQTQMTDQFAPKYQGTQRWLRRYAFLGTANPSEWGILPGGDGFRRWVPVKVNSSYDHLDSIRTKAGAYCDESPSICGEPDCTGEKWHVRDQWWAEARHIAETEGAKALQMPKGAVEVQREVVKAFRYEGDIGRQILDGITSALANSKADPDAPDGCVLVREPATGASNMAPEERPYVEAFTNVYHEGLTYENMLDLAEITPNMRSQALRELKTALRANEWAQSEKTVRRPSLSLAAKGTYGMSTFARVARVWYAPAPIEEDE